jgi:RNase P subunit RPR2
MEDIICPKCSDVLKPSDSWDFMDGEEHRVTCSCGYRFLVIIERPIEYYMLEAK